jgi:DNA-binding SARP family transcriptional activator
VLGQTTVTSRHPTDRWIARERVDRLFDRIHDVPATLVIAPAGSGKTTALSQFTQRSPHPVVWYRTDSIDGGAQSFLHHLERTLCAALEESPSGWHSVRDAVDRLEQPGLPPIVIVIDDFHLLRDRPAAGVVEHLMIAAPGHVRLVLSSRTLPSFDVSRLRLSGRLHEIAADDLRFRTWEAELLVNDLYGLVLGPEDVARLTRRVGGWAAGLQLYHLAVRNKPPTEQRRLIDIASSRSPLARQYLTRNVLDELPAELREFLLVTSVLGVVSGPIADRLLGRSGSDRLLRRLEELQLFVMPIGEDGVYRYHEVLRSHLETELGELVGQVELTTRFATAAPLLESEGFTGEAMRCSARAGRWDEVARLVGSRGADPFDQLFAWLDLLPSGVADDDPWLLLARARADVSSGRLRAAIDQYHRAETLFADPEASRRCSAERNDVESLLDPYASIPTGWLGELRRGLRADPLGAANTLDELGTAPARLASGLLRLGAGATADAKERFDAVLLDDDSPQWAVVAAHLGRLVLRLVDPTSPSPAADLDQLAQQHEHDWFARLARALLALTDRTDGVSEARRVALRCRHDGDPWGEMLALLCAGLGGLSSGARGADDLVAAADLAHHHHAALVEVLALDAAVVALRSRGDNAAVDVLGRADRVRRTLRSSNGLPLTFLDHLEDLVTGERSGTVAAPSAQRRTTVKCFGGFSLTGPDGRADLSGLRPRARSVVHLLARHAGSTVHSDVLQSSLWPEATADSARRNLQVAISAARKGVEHTGARLQRDGDGYVLVVDAADVTSFESALRELDLAVGAGDASRVVAASRACLGHYTGELLVEEGAAEWVIRDREHLRLAAAGAARRGATAALRLGDPGGAIAFAERGVAIDRFDDSLWQLIISIHDERDELGAASRARSAYERMLDELGVIVDRSGSITSSAGTRVP